MVDTRIVVSVDYQSEPCSNGSLPDVFYVWGQKQRVLELLDQWPGQHAHYFKIRTADGALYILRRDRDLEEWTLCMYLREGCEDVLACETGFKEMASVA